MLIPVLALLAGCGGLSPSAAVRPGLEVEGADVPQVRLVFPGPAVGAAPEQILRGFIRSLATSDGDYSTARSFLTDDAGRAWQPDGPIAIFSTESEMTFTSVDASTVSLAAPLVATIDPQGRYTAAATGERSSITMTFAQVSGQWRIASLPEGFGRWIASAEVRRLLRPYAVHYVAVDRRALIEDVRWFPLDRLTSRLARAQLDLVPTDLAGVATTAVPAGSRLSADSVSVTSGVATVELSVRMPTDQTQRQDLWAQFVSTLTQDPTVASVALRADGVAIDLPGVSAPVSDIAQVGFPAAPVPAVGMLARRGDVLVTFDPVVAVASGDPKAEPTPRSDLPVIPQAWTGLAQSADGKEFAAVSRDRAAVNRWRGRDRFEVQGLLGTGLADPTYDVRGHLWIGGVPADGVASPIVTVNLAESAQTAAARPVTAPWLAGRAVRVLRVSPDGARVAILSRGRDGDTRLDVAGVQRGAAGVPTALTAPITLGAGRGALVGVAWVDTTTVASLAPTGTGQDQAPLLLSLDGTTSTLPTVAAGTSLSTPGGDRQLVVHTSADQLLVRSGQLWVSAGPASDVLIPGR